MGRPAGRARQDSSVVTIDPPTTRGLQSPRHGPNQPPTGRPCTAGAARTVRTEGSVQQVEYRQLGKWGLRISKVGLGSYLTIGMHVSEDVARECVELAFSSGVNWFDTANAYNRGEAEKVLGKLLSPYPRESFVLATKVWAPMGDGPNDRGLSAKHVFEQCHASLRRLGMDYIDLYQCHRPDPDTPLEETIRVMDDLARQCKILYWGCSEWPAALMQECRDMARMMVAAPGQQPAAP